MKRVLSLILCIAIALSCVVITQGKSDSLYGTDIPTIYVSGAFQKIVIRNEEGQREKEIYPIKLSKDDMMALVKENIGVFAKAFFTQKWDEFCVMLTGVMEDLFAELRLDENAKPVNNSGPYHTWTRKTIKAVMVNGQYALDSFHFHYDWRLDPYETADILHRYIEDVLYVTGEEKVNLIGRCYGASVTAAYMEKYDGENVASWIMYNSALGASVQSSKCFTGEIWLDADGIERYAYDLTQITDDALREIVEAFATFFGKTYKLDIAAWAVNNVYKDIYLKVVPPIVTRAYGTFPSFWSMVRVQDYEKAKEVAFYGEEPEKWANFISIIDNFHDNVKTKMPELLARMESLGIPVYNITKYGFQTMPVTRDITAQTDGTCYASESSLGAVTAELLETLDADYIEKAKVSGTDKYIAPDEQIDASTCLLPDRTWFIKDLAHNIFPDSVERMMATIFNTENMDINANADYPQFLVYDKESEELSPMTKDNCNTMARYHTTYFAAVRKFWKAIFKLIKRLFESKKATA